MKPGKEPHVGRELRVGHPCRLCVEQAKHITGACDIIEKWYGTLFTT